MAAFATLDLVQLTSKAGDGTAEALEWLREAARHTGDELYHALASLGSAYASLAGGKPEEAVASAQAAVDVLQHLGCRGLLGRALDVQGRSLVDSDRGRAASTLKEAASVLGACGAIRRRDESLRALRTLGAAARKAAANLRSTTLTPRERQVATLAARGRTARETAEELAIGERTVESYLASAYGKLGVASKGELIRRARDLGLLTT
jgi:DNA-binding CsgD family transcriptional regulator